jgi:hypothetical protein
MKYRAAGRSETLLHSPSLDIMCMSSRYHSRPFRVAQCVRDLCTERVKHVEVWYGDRELPSP